MEINDIIRLMQAVTENGLTSFTLEEGNIKLSIKRERELVAVTGSAVVSAEAAGVMMQPRLSGKYCFRPGMSGGGKR